MFNLKLINLQGKASENVFVIKNNFAYFTKTYLYGTATLLGDYNLLCFKQAYFVIFCAKITNYISRKLSYHNI